MQYFGEQEHGKKESVVSEISIPVWNGIVSIFERFYNKQYFASDFPEYSRNGKSLSGTNEKNFFDSLKGHVPAIVIPIRRISENVGRNKSVYDFGRSAGVEMKPRLDTYAVLEFLQFCHQHIRAVVQMGYHTNSNHSHYERAVAGDGQKEFRDEVNMLLSRNSLVYRLEATGNMTRVLSQELSALVSRRFQTNDTRLTALFNEALDFIKQPRFDDRKRALEKLWDAFERTKTLFGGAKNVSAKKMVESMSQGNPAAADLFQAEAYALTSIGNDYQIRHFEQDKHDILSDKHIDYLFHRMLAFLDLAIDEIRI